MVNLKKQKTYWCCKSAGADIVKFQIFDTDLTTKKTPKANYQQKLKFKSQYDMLKKLNYQTMILLS